MVVALVNSPIQTAASVGCKKQDHAEQDTINDVSLRNHMANTFVIHICTSASSREECDKTIWNCTQAL